MPTFFSRNQPSRFDIAARVERRRTRAARQATIERLRTGAVAAAPWAAGAAAFTGVLAWITRPARRNAIARGFARTRRAGANLIKRDAPARTDAALTDRVHDSIAALEAELGIAPIAVTGHDGEVEIDGTVQTRAAAAAIERAVAGVPGVRSLESHLTVAGPAASEQPPQRRIRRMAMGRLRPSRQRTTIDV